MRITSSAILAALLAFVGGAEAFTTGVSFQNDYRRPVAGCTRVQAGGQGRRGLRLVVGTWPPLGVARPPVCGRGEGCRAAAPGRHGPVGTWVRRAARIGGPGTAGHANVPRPPKDMGAGFVVSIRPPLRRVMQDAAVIS
jgi:hypothetical protein